MQTPLMAASRAAAWQVWVSTVGRLFSIGSLRLEEDVMSQLSKLRSENIRLRAEVADYASLRRQLGVPAVSDYAAIPAHIVGRPIDTFRTQYILNRGARDGLVLGAPVIVFDSTLVGFVTDLDETAATFQLLIHPATNLTAEVLADDEGETRGRGLLRGRHYTSTVLTTIPRDVPIQPGQAVVTSAKELLIPGALAIGTIEEVKSLESEAYQEATVRLPYDPDTLTAVHVLVTHE